MIYVASGALVEFIRGEEESEALRSWRGQRSSGIELATSELADLETTRTLLRSGVDHQRVPYVAGQALRGLPLLDLSSAVLARPRATGSASWVRWTPSIWPRPSPSEQN